MWARRRAWVAVAAVVTVVGIVPLALDRDSFPLSTFPMFSADIDTTQSIDTAVGVRDDGTTVRLQPSLIGGTSVVNQSVAVVQAAVAGGTAARLCAEIADRVATDRSLPATAVLVVTESYDAPGWFEGDRTPVQRTVHATCPVER